MGLHAGGFDVGLALLLERWMMVRWRGGGGGGGGEILRGVWRSGGGLLRGRLLRRGSGEEGEGRV